MGRVRVPQLHLVNCSPTTSSFGRKSRDPGPVPYFRKRMNCPAMVLTDVIGETLGKQDGREVSRPVRLRVP